MVISTSKFAEALRAAKAAKTPEQASVVKSTFIAAVQAEDKPIVERSSAKRLDTSMLKLTKTGSTKLYVIIGGGALIAILLMFKKFKSIIKL